MLDSSVFVKSRKPGDCGDSPINALYYDGTSTLVPVLSAGSIVFQGAKSYSKSRGIGFNGPSSAPGNNFFKIAADDIQKGGSGVKVRACTPSLKKKSRFKCCSVNCAEFQERTAIEIKAISSCENQIWYTWVSMKEVFFECGCTESCCQKLNKLKAQFDNDPDSPVTATVVNVGDDWFIEIEAKVAGVDYLVKSSEGLTKEDVIVPNYLQSFTAGTMREWFPDSDINSLAADTCMDAIEVFFWDKVLVRGTSGTSNPLTDNSRYETILNKSIVVFKPGNANATAAKNAFLTILTGTDERNKRLLSTQAVDFAAYPYCIVRTDAGSAANLETVRTDYPTGVLSLARSTYANGKSYYSLSSSSATVPTAVGTDVINRGFCGRDDMPCNVPDGCPEIEGSLCLNC